MKIRDLAREHNVPVLQAPPLARALYTHTEVDHEIPARLFSAVAQVLAHVYQLRAALAGRGQMPADLAHIAVPPDLDPLMADTAEAAEAAEAARKAEAAKPANATPTTEARADAKSRKADPT